MGSKGFASFAISKVIASTFTIFGVICVSFVIFRLVPGDPIRMMCRDPRISMEQMQAMREKFGLDKPLPVQFIRYFKELSHGNLGISFWQKRPVIEVIAARIPRTLLLVLTALVIAVTLGTILGALAGWKSGTKSESIILAFSLSVYSVPTFCMGITLLMTFGYLVAIFPLGGISTPALGLRGFGHFKDVAWHMFLPATSIVFWYIGEYVLLTRSSMMDVLGQDYITTARAKGLKESAILRDHALRNALLPVVTLTGINLAFAVAGVIEAETVFSWPGIGKLVYDAVMRRDYPLLQGTFLIFAIAVVLGNLTVDLIYGYIDPRIRVGKKD